MKLHLIKIDKETIIWANHTKKATFGKFIEIKVGGPFVLLLQFPYFEVFVILMINLSLNLIRNYMRANRWKDLIRPFRYVLNGGYWTVTSKQKIRQLQRSVSYYKDFNTH